MSNKDGRLTPEEQQTAIDWLSQKAPNMTCAACGKKNFTILPHLLSPPVFYGGGMVVGGPSYPQVVAACTNCGHLLNFSAVMIGVIPNIPPKEER